MKKTELWRNRIQDVVTNMFPQLTDFFHTNNLYVAIVRRGSYISPHCTE